jgi:hypothetical protein
MGVIGVELQTQKRKPILNHAMIVGLSTPQNSVTRHLPGTTRQRVLA